MPGITHLSFLARAKLSRRSGPAALPRWRFLPASPFPRHATGSRHGDALFFFTDGVTEALGPMRDFYTPQRLETVLRSVHALPVGKITRAVMHDVRTFCGDREQADDISVMALRWLGAPHRDLPSDTTHLRENQPARHLKT